MTEANLPLQAARWELARSTGNETPGSGQSYFLQVSLPTTLVFGIFLLANGEQLPHPPVPSVGSLSWGVQLSSFAPIFAFLLPILL